MKPLGQVAYDAWRERFDEHGRTWEQLPASERERWEEVATVVGTDVSRMLMGNLGKRR